MEKIKIIFFQPKINSMMIQKKILENKRILKIKNFSNKQKKLVREINKKILTLISIQTAHKIVK